MRRLRYEQQREKERVLAQYEAIKSQVNPHFLFNSFNTLMAMIKDEL
ncbi:MAG: histidine kinase [Owenweeksia sp.]|nr:histidine kinase [Owenweeksia sp.]